ncbi:GrpB family protein [Ensifer sp. NM-2]|uniref:GrpB family protein n=1 Tax=Ensifer sp. NM-2 TaxID=2109730 RepID=UPI000D1303AA|nr:GrpB family protein [Ensifer sp. NM-2]PSS64499.1 GrpB family protein [Ensifer sp. NM-2]
MPTTEETRDALGEVSIISPDEAWPAQFEAERRRLLSLLGKSGQSLQHFGSTAVPNLKAKPIIDMMAPIASLPIDCHLSGRLAEVGYIAVDAGFFKRAFFRRPASGVDPAFHLHLVFAPSWPMKNELLLRDWLIANPDVARAYEALKLELARQFPDNMPRYTSGKTAFLRAAVNDARASIGLPPETDWDE